MDFLYFEPTPNLTQIPSDLAYAFATRPATHQVTGDGPGGSSGTLLCGGAFRDALHRVGYYPEQQDWRRVPNTTRWIGWYRDELPTPDELERRDVLPYNSTELNEQQWKIPKGLRFDGERFVSALPQVLDLNDEGKWVSGGVEQKYRGLFESALLFWDSISGAIDEENEAELTIDDLAERCVSAIAANYRVSCIECACLGMLTDANLSRIVSAVVDLPAFRKYADANKKKRSDQHGRLNLTVGV